jgi:hypothetical protein
MLYKFKSPATAPIIMLEPNGRQILHILGKDDPANLVKGILLPQDIPAAIAALEAAVVQDDAAIQQRQDEAKQEGEALPTPDGISLSQRAAPFIDMLQRAHQAEEEIVWGV